jgi:hypothetical protein
MDNLPDHRAGQIHGQVFYGATNRDLCEHFGITQAELEAQYGERLIQWRADRRLLLRKKQTILAVDGNASMLSLLGKHELGQSTSASSDNPWPEPQLDYKMG